MKRVKNWELKLLSLVIAVLLAYFVNNTSNSSVISFLSPIEIANLPATRTIVWPRVRQTQVTIKGPSFLVSRIAASPPGFKIDVPPEAKNHYLASLNANDLGPSPAVQVISIDPPEIEFTFDELVTKELPVEVARIGSLDENLSLAGFQVEPDKVTISGPEVELKQISHLETRPIDLRGLRGDLHEELAVQRPQSAPLSKIAPDRVRVSLLISSVKVIKNYPELAVEVRAEPGTSYAVVPSAVAVEVSGPKQAIEALKGGEIIPYVRPGASDPESSPARVLVDAPNGISAVAVEPDKVMVTRQAKSAAKSPEKR